MIEYVFSEEIYREVYGKPKGKDIWYFGDRNKTVLVTIGSEDKLVKYNKAKREAVIELERLRYPLYKTVYLHISAKEDEVEDSYDTN